MYDQDLARRYRHGMTPYSGLVPMATDPYGRRLQYPEYAVNPQLRARGPPGPPAGHHLTNPHGHQFRQPVFGEIAFSPSSYRTPSAHPQNQRYGSPRAAVPRMPALPHSSGVARPVGPQETATPSPGQAATDPPPASQDAEQGGDEEGSDIEGDASQDAGTQSPPTPANGPDASGNPYASQYSSPHEDGKAGPSPQDESTAGSESQRRQSNSAASGSPASPGAGTGEDTSLNAHTGRGGPTPDARGTGGAPNIHDGGAADRSGNRRRVDPGVTSPLPPDTLGSFAFPAYGPYHHSPGLQYATPRYLQHGYAEADSVAFSDSTGMPYPINGAPPSPQFEHAQYAAGQPYVRFAPYTQPPLTRRTPPGHSFPGGYAYGEPAPSPYAHTPNPVPDAHVHGHSNAVRGGHTRRGAGGDTTNISTPPHTNLAGPPPGTPTASGLSPALVALFTTLTNKATAPTTIRVDSSKKFDFTDTSSEGYREPVSFVKDILLKIDYPNSPDATASALKAELLDPQHVCTDSRKEMETCISHCTTVRGVLEQLATLFSGSDPSAHYLNKLTDMKWQTSEDPSRLASRIIRMVGHWMTVTGWANGAGATSTISEGEATRKAVETWYRCIRSRGDTGNFVAFLRAGSETIADMVDLRKKAASLSAMLAERDRGVKPKTKPGIVESDRYRMLRGKAKLSTERRQTINLLAASDVTLANIEMDPSALREIDEQRRDRRSRVDRQQLETKDVSHRRSPPRKLRSSSDSPRSAKPKQDSRRPGDRDRQSPDRRPHPYSRGPSTPDRPRPSTNRQWTKKSICYKFQDTGRCSYGDTCRFAHVCPDLMTCKQSGCGYAHPCPEHALGRCGKGVRCKLEH